MQHTHTHKVVTGRVEAKKLFSCQRQSNYSGGWQPMVHVVTPQIWTKDPRTCTICIPAYGAPIGGIRVLFTIKITVICQVHMYFGLSLKVNMCETSHDTRRSWMHFVCICFCVCGRQKSQYAPWLTVQLQLVHRFLSFDWLNCIHYFNYL